MVPLNFNEGHSLFFSLWPPSLPLSLLLSDSEGTQDTSTWRGSISNNKQQQQQQQHASNQAGGSGYVAPHTLSSFPLSLIPSLTHSLIHSFIHLLAHCNLDILLIHPSLTVRTSTPTIVNLFLFVSSSCRRWCRWYVHNREVGWGGVGWDEVHDEREVM